MQSLKAVKVSKRLEVSINRASSNHAIAALRFWFFYLSVSSLSGVHGSFILVLDWIQFDI